MRRWMLTLAGLVLTVVAVAGAALAGAAGAAGDPPRADLRGFVCRNALDPADRSISAKAVMRPVPGTQKLQLRFALLVNHPGTSGQTSVRAGNLGMWLTPKNPTLGQLPGDVWNFSKSVVELDAPATYQFRVSYRWLGAGGKVLATAQRTTRRCKQRELRPDLMVLTPVTIKPVPGHPAENSYSAVVRNAGATAAGPFVVEFVSYVSPSVTDVSDVNVQRLGPNSTTSVSFVGPVCSASDPPTITADSTQEVDDLNRDNNTAVVNCGGGSRSGSTFARRYPS